MQFIDLVTSGKKYLFISFMRVERTVHLDIRLNVNMPELEKDYFPVAVSVGPEEITLR